MNKECIQCGQSFTDGEDDEKYCGSCEYKALQDPQPPAQNGGEDSTYVFDTTAEKDRHYICQIGRLFWGDNKQCYDAFAVYRMAEKQFALKSQIEAVIGELEKEANERWTEYLRTSKDADACVQFGEMNAYKDSANRLKELVKGWE